MVVCRSGSAFCRNFSPFLVHVVIDRRFWYTSFLEQLVLIDFSVSWVMIWPAGGDDLVRVSFSCLPWFLSTSSWLLISPGVILCLLCFDPWDICVRLSKSHWVLQAQFPRFIIVWFECWFWKLEWKRYVSFAMVNENALVPVISSYTGQLLVHNAPEQGNQLESIFELRENFLLFN